MLPLDRIHAAAEINLLTHMSWVQARAPGMSVSADEQLALIDSGLPCDTFNCVCRARLDPVTAEARILGVRARFRAAGRPFSWWVGPLDAPHDLRTRLEQCGFSATEGEMAMAADLNVPAGDTQRVSDLRITRVLDASQLQDFAGVMAANWNPPDPNVVAFYTLATPFLLQPDCPIRLYAGYIDEQAVAGAEMTVAGGVAGLYSIGTRRDFRRRGIGAAMVQHALDEARAHGLITAVLQAARGAEGLYARAGFVETGAYVEYQPSEA